MIENIIKNAIHEEFDQLKKELLESMENATEKQRYMTRKDVANYLGIGLSTVDYWSRLGKLKKVNIGGSIRFDKVELDEIFSFKNTPK